MVQNPTPVGHEARFVQSGLTVGKHQVPILHVSVHDLGLCSPQALALTSVASHSAPDGRRISALHKQQ